jgi:hypothetical protein
MKPVLPPKFLLSLWIAVLCVSYAASMQAQDVDLTPQYQWKPVEIGAGGWMRGLAVASSGAAAYARGDVDQVYRWSNAAKQWFPTKLSSALPPAYTGAPVNAGGGAIAIDPSNANHVLVVFTLNGSADLGNSWGLNVFYSTDGAMTYKAANLNLSCNLAAETTGERLAIDSKNGNVAYLGPPGGGSTSGSPCQGKADGLERSLDGGATWSQVTGGGLPASTASVRYEFQLPRIDGGSGSASVGGQTASQIVYVSYIRHDESNNDAVLGGGVLKSADGGNTWTDITGTALESGAATVGFATLDSLGNLWIVDHSNNNLYRHARGGSSWTVSTPPHGGGSGVAVDLNQPQRIFALGGNQLARSLDSGASWTDLGAMQFAADQTIAWLDPSSFRPQGHYVSVSGLYFDATGQLWAAGANDGILTYTPNDSDTSSTWTSISEGIEEAVAEPSVIPPGSNPVLTVEDETLFTITDPDSYTAQHFSIDLWSGGDGLSSATDSNYAPNQPKYVVEVTANLSEGNPAALSSQFSGYSADGGSTWQLFPSIANGSHPCILYFGSIAVSARAAGHENDAAGADNLVWIPSNDNDFAVFAQGPAPFYSKDGGATWTQTASFNNAPGATKRSECGSTSYTYMDVQWGPWIFALSQHLLVADPIMPGTFYMDLTAGGFWKSTDGGETWTQQTATNAPSDPHHGTLATVPGVSGEMWMVDGHEGATTHGLFHTLDGGNTFTRSPLFDYAWALALGKAAQGQSYPAIYVDGLYHGDANWGVFQSIDGGTTFNRIAYYPYGILDVPNTMAASWDVFGTVYIGFEGNTFYYGAQNNTSALPGSPTLAATAGDAAVNLHWSPASGGTPTGFSLYRGTATGQEAAAPLATFDGTTYSYQDAGLSEGATYYYVLTASNGLGVGPKSNEASAVIASPSISLAAASGASLSATVNAGSSAVFNLALGSVNYAGTVTLICTGAPTGGSCSSAPSTVTPGSGTTSTPVTITVKTTSATAVRAGRNRPLLGLLLWPIGLLSLPLLHRRRRLRAMAAGWLAMVILVAMSACGSGNSQPAASTYTLTVTATGTGGIAPATASLSLTVQP